MKIANRVMLLMGLIAVTGAGVSGCGGSKNDGGDSSAPVGKPTSGSGPVDAGKGMSDGATKKVSDDGGKVPMAK